MEVVKATPNEKSEKLTKLADVPCGDVFRLPEESFETAIGGDDPAGFRMVTQVNPKTTGRIDFVSLDGKIVGKMDEDRMVVVHPAKLAVSEAEMV